MGIPTIPNYIITSSIAGPALLALDVPLLVSHMFVFYFGIMADLTPPVALAAFAAAPMAQGLGHADRGAGDQARGRRLRRAVHGGLHAVADAAGRRRHRRGLRLSGRGRLRLPQGLPRHRRSSGAAVVGFLSRPHAALGARSSPRAAALLLVLAVPWTDEAGFALAAPSSSRVHWWRLRPGGGMSLCVSPAPRRSASRSTAFTLGWTHSVEHVRWEEDWRVTPAGLELVEARVQGSGAGMEPPEGARLAGGWWTWRPARPPQRRARARRLRRHRRRLDPLRRRSLPRDRRRGGRAAAAVRLRLSTQSRARSAVSSARRPAISAAALDRWAISGAVRPLSIARE